MGKWNEKQSRETAHDFGRVGSPAKDHAHGQKHLPTLPFVFSPMPAISLSLSTVPSAHRIGEGAASRNPFCALNPGRIKIAIDTWGLA